ncbi:AAA family ATPase [Flagellimonas abyssi]|uniref:AAA family ATPase n=1 Tax=Flagellimonas abyssi TaxID=2864871 RepID=A0ABS7ES52_9FLAO|nr:AAA family ATPase [Allomuricauda abyssi]MBC72364.1 ATPase [Allomuricauda sp.]MBW8200415.1 AAA family ATPase [Allomuricauda abyssi]
MKRTRIHNPFYVITGGPGVGKTSLLEALQIRGYTVIPEVARQLIKEKQAIDGDALPWKNKRLYRDLMFQRSLESFEKVMKQKQGSSPIFFDRGFLDAICYASLTGIRVENDMKILAETWRYNDHVFILPPWKEIYQTDAQRKQDWNEAVFTYNKMIQTYRSYQYNLVEVPKTTIGERAEFILTFVTKEK